MVALSRGGKRWHDIQILVDYPCISVDLIGMQVVGLTPSLPRNAFNLQIRSISPVSFLHLQTWLSVQQSCLRSAGPSQVVARLRHLRRYW